MLTILEEMRSEIGERFGRIDRMLADHWYRLNLLQAAIASLKADVATLTSTVPVLHERLDNSKPASPRSKRDCRRSGDAAAGRI